MSLACLLKCVDWQAHLLEAFKKQLQSLRVPSACVLRTDLSNRKRCTASKQLCAHAGVATAAQRSAHEI